MDAEQDELDSSDEDKLDARQQQMALENARRREEAKRQYDLILKDGYTLDAKDSCTVCKRRQTHCVFLFPRPAGTRKFKCAECTLSRQQCSAGKSAEVIAARQLNVLALNREGDVKRAADEARLKEETKALNAKHRAETLATTRAHEQAMTAAQAKIHEYRSVKAGFHASKEKYLVMAQSLEVLRVGFEQKLDMTSVIQGIERVNAIPNVVLPEGSSRRIQPVSVTDVDVEDEEVTELNHR